MVSRLKNKEKNNLFLLFLLFLFAARQRGA